MFLRIKLQFTLGRGLVRFYYVYSKQRWNVL